jgi:hypothetical protein
MLNGLRGFRTKRLSTKLIVSKTGNGRRHPQVVWKSF